MNKHKIRKLIEDAGEDRVVQDKLMEVICEVMEMLEEKDPKEYKEIEKKMYDDGIMHGMDSGFDKQMAEYIVNKIYDRNHMSKSDRLFTYQKAEQLAKQHKIDFDDFTLEDWYITLVMAESDFKELLGTNMDNYVTYAKLWLMDKDAPDGGSCKLYDYLVYVAQLLDEDDEKGYDDGYDMDYATGGINGRYYGTYNYPRMNRNMSHANGMYGYDDRSRSSRRRYDNGHDMYEDEDMPMYDDRSRYDNTSRGGYSRSSYMGNRAYGRSTGQNRQSMRGRGRR